VSALVIGVALPPVEDDPLLFVTHDEALADRAIRDQHWIDEDDVHFVVTAALLSRTDSVEGRAWSIHGYTEGGEDGCSVKGT
jgi:hypothetical protein